MRKLKVLATVLVVFLSSSAYGALGVTASSGAGQPGGVVVIDLALISSTNVNFQVRLNYDDTNLTADLSSCGGVANIVGDAIPSCVSNAGYIAIGGASGSNSVLPSADLGSISFTINGAVMPPANFPLTVSNEVYSEGPPAFAALTSDSSSDGAITVALVGPAYTSDVVSGTALTFATGVIEGGMDPSDSIDITNTGTASTTLTGACALSGADAGKFSITPSGGAFSVNDGAAAAIISVACDASTAGTFAASLDCTHNENMDTEAYALSCTIDPALPTYAADSTALTFAPLVETTAPASTGTLDLTNTGDAGSQLAGTCSIANEVGGSAFTVTNGAAFDIATTDAAHTVTVECSTAAAGAYTADLSCAHNDAVTGTPTVHAMACTVSAAGEAIYASSPVADGGTIEMTGGVDPVVEGTVTTFDLDISNAATLITDNNLDLVGCDVTAGSAEITLSAPLTASLATMGGSTTATFTCDTSTAGNFSSTFTCPYSTDGDTGVQENTASYTVNCDVRAAASASSPSTSTLNIVAPPGGSAAGIVTIAETLGEGQTITGLACTLDAMSSTDFTITTVPAAMIASGGDTTLEVTLTDGGNDPLTGSITCNYMDSNGANQFTITLAGSIRAIVVPTLSAMGYAALIFGLLLVGFFGVRRRA